MNESKHNMSILMTWACALLCIVATFASTGTASEPQEPFVETPELQMIEDEQTVFDQLYTAYSKMDLNQFSSGILFDLGAVLYGDIILENDGCEKDCSTTLTTSDFNNVYYAFVQSSIQQRLPSYTQVKETAQHIREQDQRTPLALAVITYDRIDPEAYGDGRVTSQEGYFLGSTDNTPVSHTHTFFAAAVTAPQVYGPSVEFIIPSTLILTNSKIPIIFDDLTITFSGSSTPLHIRIDQPFTVSNLKRDTNNMVQFCLSGMANGNQFFMYGSFVYAPLIIPDHKELPQVTATIPYIGVQGSINIRVYPSGGTVTGVQGNYDVQLKNLMFIVDGFDVLNDRTQDDIWYDFGSGMQKFLDMGFDLISIDYTQGNDFIQRNGLAIREAFKNIPEWMAPGFESQRAVVMAGSMGTQTARYALRTAELDYEDHHVGLFVALDGPFKGANIPLGLQGFVTLAAKTFGGEAQDLLNGLNSIAASQMLTVNRYPTVVQMPPPLPPHLVWHWCEPNPLYNSYYTEVNALGLPQQCRNVAVASGNGFGLRLSTHAYENYGYVDDMKSVTLFPLKAEAGVQIATYSDHPGTVFDGYIGVKIKIHTLLFGWQTLLEIGKDLTVTCSAAQCKYLDLAPGGTRDSIKTAVDAFNDATVINVVEWINNLLGTHISWNIHFIKTMTYSLGDHSFIPTYSALAVDTTDVNYAPGTDPALYSKTPFDNVYFESGNSIGHVGETFENMEFMKNELYGFLATQRAGQLAITEDGIYRVQQDGDLIRHYPLNSPTQVQTIPHWSGALHPYSLIAGFPDDSNKNIYGVNKNGKVFTTWKNNGIITFAPISIVNVAAGSLVLGKAMNSGNGTAPGIYGTGPRDGYNAVNLYYNTGWCARSAQGGYPIPGSLVYGNNVIFGVDSSGCICMIRQENGLLKYYRVMSDYTDIVPGSLCFGYSMWSGDGTAPGLYAVTREGTVVNYRWVNNAWQRRTTDWGTVVPGSLILGDKEIYGVTPQGTVCLIRQESGTLKYYHVLENYKDVHPGSLCWGNDMWSTTIPGLYAVNTFGNIVNYRYGSGWSRRDAFGVGMYAVAPGSLVRGGTRIFGVDCYDQLVSVEHLIGQGGSLLWYSVW
ncbi:MAG: PQQ-like beta-propeller repeat protein [Candidatus Thermoplasmatota archaeon]|nr:PQQ-like beta-propeller repeat protein [Candidatus Thermoplasmatota archaeon]